MTRAQETTFGDEMTASAAVRESAAVSIADLREHPNCDHVWSEADAAEMAASIAQHGLIEPLLVQKSTMTIIAGHRRKWGLQKLGSTTARAELVDVADDVALVLLQVSNNHRQRPDPMRESESVAALLALPGWNVTRAAEALRVTPRWVARRANLRKLAPSLQKLALDKEHFLSRWPAEWLEHLAILDQGVQETLLKDRVLGDWITEEAELEGQLSKKLHVLGKAPWDLADAKLLPKAGSCIKCPKTTASQPELFGEEAENPDIKTARCKDAACWMKKVNAHIRNGIAAAREKDAKCVVVDQTEYSAHIDALRQVNAVHPYQVKKCAAVATGAKPAVFVKSDGRVEEGFVEPSAAAGGGAAAPAKRKKAKKADAKQDLEASRKEIGERRWQFVLDEIREAVEDEKLYPSAHSVRALALVCGAEQAVTPKKWSEPYGAKALGKCDETAKDEAKWARAMWPGVRSFIADTFLIGEDHREDIAWVAHKVGLDVTKLAAKAIEEIPDPKWWPKADGAAAGARKPAKASAKKPKAKASR